MATTVKADTSIRKAVMYLVKKSAIHRHPNCGDDYGGAFFPTRVVFRWSRMKFGTTEPAWSAIAAWMTTTNECVGEFDESFVDLDTWSLESRAGEILRGICDASRNDWNG